MSNLVTLELIKLASIKTSDAKGTHRDKPEKPPHLKDSVGSAQRCGTCKHYQSGLMEGACTKYKYPVTPVQTCDSYEPQSFTPPEAPPPDPGNPMPFISSAQGGFPTIPQVPKMASSNERERSMLYSTKRADWLNATAPGQFGSGSITPQAQQPQPNAASGIAPGQAQPLTPSNENAMQQPQQQMPAQPQQAQQPQQQQQQSQAGSSGPTQTTGGQPIMGNFKPSPTLGLNPNDPRAAGMMPFVQPDPNVLSAGAPKTASNIRARDEMWWLMNTGRKVDYRTKAAVANIRSADRGIDVLSGLEKKAEKFVKSLEDYKLDVINMTRGCRRVKSSNDHLMSNRNMLECKALHHNALLSNNSMVGCRVIKSAHSALSGPPHDTTPQYNPNLRSLADWWRVGEIVSQKKASRKPLSSNNLLDYSTKLSGDTRALGPLPPVSNAPNLQPNVEAIAERVPGAAYHHTPLAGETGKVSGTGTPFGDLNEFAILRNKLRAAQLPNMQAEQSLWKNKFAPAPIKKAHLESSGVINYSTKKAATPALGPPVNANKTLIGTQSPAGQLNAAQEAAKAVAKPQQPKPATAQPMQTGAGANSTSPKMAALLKLSDGMAGKGKCTPVPKSGAYTCPSCGCTWSDKTCAHCGGKNVKQAVSPEFVTNILDKSIAAGRSIPIAQIGHMASIGQRRTMNQRLTPLGTTPLRGPPEPNLPRDTGIWNDLHELHGAEHPMLKTITGPGQPAGSTASMAAKRRTGALPKGYGVMPSNEHDPIARDLHKGLPNTAPVLADRLEERGHGSAFTEPLRKLAEGLMGDSKPMPTAPGMNKPNSVALGGVPGQMMDQGAMKGPGQMSNRAGVTVPGVMYGQNNMPNSPGTAAGMAKPAPTMGQPPQPMGTIKPAVPTQQQVQPQPMGGPAAPKPMAPPKPATTMPPKMGAVINYSDKSAELFPQSGPAYNTTKIQFPTVGSNKQPFRMSDRFNRDRSDMGINDIIKTSDLAKLAANKHLVDYVKSSAADWESVKGWANDGMRGLNTAMFGEQKAAPQPQQDARLQSPKATPANNIPGYSSTIAGPPRPNPNSPGQSLSDSEKGQRNQKYDPYFDASQGPASPTAPGTLGADGKGTPEEAKQPEPAAEAPKEEAKEAPKTQAGATPPAPTQQPAQPAAPQQDPAMVAKWRATGGKIPFERWQASWNASGQKLQDAQQARQQQGYTSPQQLYGGQTPPTAVAQSVSPPAPGVAPSQTAVTQQPQAAAPPQGQQPMKPGAQPNIAGPPAPTQQMPSLAAMPGAPQQPQQQMPALGNNAAPGAAKPTQQMPALGGAGTSAPAPNAAGAGGAKPAPANPGGSVSPNNTAPGVNQPPPTAPQTAGAAKPNAPGSTPIRTKPQPGGGLNAGALAGAKTMAGAGGAGGKTSGKAPQMA